MLQVENGTTILCPLAVDKSTPIKCSALPLNQGAHSLVIEVLESHTFGGYHIMS